MRSFRRTCCFFWSGIGKGAEAARGTEAKKKQLRRQDVLKKCFERKEAKCVQPTNKTLDGYIKTDPRVKRSQDPDPESLEKKVRAPQTEKCKRCKETDVHFEVKEEGQGMLLSFSCYSRFVFF